MLYNNWENFQERLHYLSNFMKAMSMHHIYEEEGIINEATKMYPSIYNPLATTIKFRFEWDSIIRIMSTQATPELHCTVIRTMWNQISRDNSDKFGELKQVKRMLQLLLAKANKEIRRKRRSSMDKIHS